MAAFVWGDNGAQLTPEAIAAQRKVAQAMMAQAADYSPVQSAWQGAARAAQGLVGGWEGGQADAAEKRNSAAEKELLGSFLAGAPTAVAPAPAASGAVAPIASAPMGAAPIPAGVADAGLSDAIAKVAAARNVDPAYMTRLAMVESGGNVNAANPSSSARGPFQFINSTAKQYGLSNPNDPAASADAAARLTLDNKAALTAALGRDPTPGELYLAHQQGAGGASKILGNPNAPIESIVGADAARLNGAAPGMTAGQFAQKWTGKFSDVGASPAQTVAQAMPQSGVNPKLIQAYASPYVSEGTKKVLGMMLQQQMKPTEYSYQTTPDGTILRMDPRGGAPQPVYTAATKPTFEKIRTDPLTGEEIKGFVDPTKRSIEEYRPQAASAQPSTLPPVPAGVDPKVWREGQSKASLANNLPATFDDTSKLRSEFTQLPAYKNMAQAAPVYQSMREAAGRDTKAADLNIVYGLGKIMDPGSVVREGEIAMANNAQGWQEKLNGIIGQINSKGGLTPEGRQALMAEAHSRISSYKQQFDLDAGRYKGITERNRIRTEDVIPDFGTFEPWTAPKAAPAGPVEIDGYKIKAR
jgi:hypothetical protein